MIIFNFIVYISGSGGSVSGCSFINITSTGGGGVYISGSGGSVSGCSFINTTTTSGSGGGVYMSLSGSVVFNRFVNNTDNGMMVGNGVSINTDSANVSSNWYGNNTPQKITKGVMEDYYQVELSANQVLTRDLTKNVNGIVPVPLAYKMCLNGSNNTGNISNLPDFNATIKLNINNLFRSNNNFRSDIGLLRFSPFMNPGDSVDVSAKNPWNDTINNTGNYTFSALVDNQQLNLNLA